MSSTDFHFFENFFFEETKTLLPVGFSTHIFLYAAVCVSFVGRDPLRLGVVLGAFRQ